MELRAWCPTDQYSTALFLLNEAAKAALERDGVAGPLPAMKVIQANVDVPARM